ncbi:MAG: hypothetical protein ACRC7G_00625 [Beijerinckiaceae bacterium]
MPIFRIAAAIGLLALFAPEQTRQAAASILGYAEERKAELPVPAEAAMGYCRSAPEKCAAIAREAMRHASKP